MIHLTQAQHEELLAAKAERDLLVTDPFSGEVPTAEKIRAGAALLAKFAEQAGFNVTIERRPLADLAMGHTEAVVEVWPLRHPPQKA